VATVRDTGALDGVSTGMPAVYELFVLAKNSLSTAQLKTLMQNTGRAILHASDAIPSAPMSRASNDSAASPGTPVSSAPSSSAATDGSPRGVIMDIKYFGEQDLAYTIRRPGERHSSALVWQMTFGSEGSRLKEIERGLRLDEGVIRWSLLKRSYPYGDDVRVTSYKVAERARELAAQAASEHPQE
jgi:ribosomal protein S6